MSTLAVPEKELKEQGAAMVREAEALAVVDDASFIRAGEGLTLVKAYLARVDEVMNPIVDAAHKAHKVAVQQRAMLRDPALRAESIYKGHVGAYQQEQERKRREEEERQRKERERLEREARELAAAEQRRLREEEETRRLEAAAAAEARGDNETAERIVSAPITVATVVPAPVFVPPVITTAPPKVQGVSFREEWDFEVENEALIPREFLKVDEVRIRSVVKAMKKDTQIPGVRVFPRTGVAASGRR